MNFKKFLLEQAQKRKILIKDMDEKSEQIVIHLIKILKYDDTYNYNKHLNDIDGLLTFYVDISKKKTPLKLNDFKEAFLKTEKEYSKYFKALNKEYKVPVIETDENVKIKINEILIKLSSDLFNKTFNSIKQYI